MMKKILLWLLAVVMLFSATADATVFTDANGEPLNGPSLVLNAVDICNYYCMNQAGAAQITLLAATFAFLNFSCQS